MQIREIVMLNEIPVFDNTIEHVKSIREAVITADRLIREELEFKSLNCVVSVLALSEGRIKYLDMLTCEPGKMIRKKLYFDANGGEHLFSYGKDEKN